ncbi:pentapeptide repeat-containing protein [Clostridiaceae bacterium DONG20-135]|uniref:Pentapeptide repeat-containing protein n=1 Tax=Copranaerobaculum intestinale TaxID=2692629 RepID=A0A6N8UC15_9FIRM|nr:pentapeptide repeat-containing protein [Copranaerobaculum intestinale]MXQ74263.1 pentapeptide repeat-containing protein [Copranaerobaculum intestinale]
MEMKDLRIQCENCFGLCCRALYFSKMDGFPENKRAGKACSYLCAASRCSIYSQLGEKHLKGCMNYDCFGAGQHMSAWIKQQNIYITDKQMDTAVMESFHKLMKLHQQLWYLKQAILLIEEHHLHIDTTGELEKLEILLRKEPDKITKPDIEISHDAVNGILRRVSACIQTKYANDTHIIGSSFLGKSFKKQSLKGCDFSMKLLIGCDFTDADLAYVNFLGSDVRDANFSNVDLRCSLFLTQFQINSAKGNKATMLPDYLKRPRTWNK